jgi:Amidases related to nicotinamidase
MKSASPRKRRVHWVDPDVPRSHDAVLVIDAINDLDFSGGRALLRAALPAARRIAALAKRARAASVPVIYVNDNFGRWRSDFRQQVAHCLEDDCAGRPLVELLRPDEKDYFVLKPMHSGFYSTTLEVLLDRLGVRRVVITGFAADMCVLYTANDAHMRDYQIVVPRDCVASETPSRKRFALSHLANTLGVDTSPASRVRFHRVDEA